AVAPTDLSGGARAGASSPLPLGLRLAYDAIYTPGATPSTFANLVHVGVLTLDTPCRCAGLRLTASLPTHDLRALGGLQFSLLIDLKSLGSVAAFWRASMSVCSCCDVSPAASFDAPTRARSYCI